MFRFIVFAVIGLGILIASSVHAKNPGPLPDPRPKVTEADLPPLPDDKKAPWGPAVDGLSCRLVAAAEFTHGQPVRVTVQVRNQSNRTRYLFQVFDFQLPNQAVLQVTGPDGKPVRQNRKSETAVDLGRFLPLEPGQVRRFDFLDIRDLFQEYVQKEGRNVPVDAFRQEGRYTLTYSYKGPKMPERTVIGERTTSTMEGKQVVEKIYAEPTREQLAGAWQGTLTAAPVTIDVRPLRANDLTVHEWGVFTVFSDVQYANVNRKAEWQSLPADFYRQLPTQRFIWRPALWDKPIVYFYTQQPSMKIRASVRFTEGAPVVWWPAAADPVDDGLGREAPGAAAAPRPKIHDRLTWEACLGPTAPSGSMIMDGNGWVKVQEFDLPKESWLREARLKEAALLTVSGSRLERSSPWINQRPETERFIFYDGLVPAPNHLRCVAVNDRVITVKNTAKFPIGPLFLIDRRQRLAAYRVTSLAAGAEERIQLHATQQPLELLFRRALTDAGLFEAEADSILKIWRKSLFGSDGVTAFYLLPQAEYDRMLPLEVQPRPVQTPVRVGIALHPQFEMGPIVTERVAELIKQLDSEEFATRETAARALEQLGPWAVKQLRDSLDARPTLDQKKRLEALLEKADASEWLRQAVARPKPATK